MVNFYFDGMLITDDSDYVRYGWRARYLARQYAHQLESLAPKHDRPSVRTMLVLGLGVARV